MTVHYAWPSYRKTWNFDVSAFSIDDEPDDGALDAEQRRIRADKSGPWSSASFNVVASTTETTPAGLDDVQAFLLVSAPATQLRQSVRLTASNTGDSAPQWSADVELLRWMVGGAVTLELSVGASWEGRRRAVGSSEPWTLVVNPVAAPITPGAPPFKSAWIDFSADEAPLRARQQPAAYALMDLSGAEPVLLLNDAVDGLRHLVLADKARLERRRLRDIVSVEIARYAVSTLMRAAADAIDPVDDDAPIEPPGSGLLRQTCEAVARTLPDVEDVETLYHRLAHAHQRGTADRADLWTGIDLAIDTLVSQSDTIAQAALEVKHA